MDIEQFWSEIGYKFGWRREKRRGTKAREGERRCGKVRRDEAMERRKEEECVRERGGKRGGEKGRGQTRKGEERRGEERRGSDRKVDTHDDDLG